MCVCMYMYVNDNAAERLQLHKSCFTVKKSTLYLKSSRIITQQHHATLSISSLSIAPHKENHPHDTLIPILSLDCLH